MNTSKKKKNAATVGTVLHKIKDPTALKPWADYLSSIDPWKTLDLTSDQLLTRWTASDSRWQFFSAADPKNAKTPGFEHEHGLIVFTTESAGPIVAKFLKDSMPTTLEDGGYVQAIGTKMRHKGIGKYLVAAAERVIQEQKPRVYLFVSDSNHAAQRFYKGLGYEEIARANDAFKSGNIEILLTKKLE